ncbi:DUF4112 domain-containing protein [Alkalinema sp. FACHB-956]|uniref:DUF4112 domain-containing protein n=1 Tax=Alkalinema sp. FACHB-956 TaxID=2692768 RepID=UPI001682ED3D|nr:DUF4112 domain-containing protein [Alkalinema sp. FACHB-956]MBD2327622.1 DUF4112 domain-containing protein [Alkalinema sp. FACHB-956]
MHSLEKMASRDQALQRVRAVGQLLDNAIAIPGTNYRVGLDPLLGLLPGGGDMVGIVVSAYIVLEAARFGVPKSTLIRMVLNILLDSSVGAIPVVGDLFDFAWKSNSRNVALLESHVTNGTLQRKVDRRFIFVLAIVLLLIVLSFAALATLVVGLVWKLIMG